MLTELESKAILSAYGIPVNPTVAASSAADAASVAQMIGFPVALKINSPDVSHKSEVDGMRFNLQNEKEVMAAYEEIITAVKASKPEANILGVTVQTQEQEAHLRTDRRQQTGPGFRPPHPLRGRRGLHRGAGGLGGGPAPLEPAPGPAVD